MISDTNFRYKEVPQVVFGEICRLLGDRLGDDIPKRVHHEIDELLRIYIATKRKPAWIIGDMKINSLLWRRCIILEGHS